MMDESDHIQTLELAMRSNAGMARSQSSVHNQRSLFSRCREGRLRACQAEVQTAFGRLIPSYSTSLHTAAIFLTIAQ